MPSPPFPTLLPTPDYLQEAPAHPSPEQRACTPLRPSYAPDLRDDSLLTHNATDKLVYQNMAFTFPGGMVRRMGRRRG